MIHRLNLHFGDSFHLHTGGINDRLRPSQLPRRFSHLPDDLFPVFLAVDDLAGGSLFVIRVTPLDEDDQPLPLPEESQPESQAFEIVFLEEAMADAPRASHAASVAEARLRAVVNGAQTTDEGHATWYWEQQQFGLTIGNTRAARISVSEVVITLQRRVLSDPAITGFGVNSPYGLPMASDEFSERRDPLPAAFARKRAEVAALLGSGGSRDVPEVFAWTVEARALIADYVASFKRAIDAATDDGSTAVHPSSVVDLDSDVPLYLKLCSLLML